MANLYFQRYVNPLGRHWALEPKDQIHKLARRLSHQAMATVRAGRTLKLQTFESRCSMNNFLDICEKGDVWLWREELARFAASVLTDAVYGFHCPTTTHPDLRTIVDLTEKAVAGVQATSIINVFPWLDNLPGPWPWRTAEDGFRKEENGFYDGLADEAVRGGRANLDTWCRQFFNSDESDDSDEPLRGKKKGDRCILVGQLLAAGNETTSNTLSTFVLAYLLHPEAFIGAVEQVERVVGDERLPEFGDWEELPLVEACFRELLRWRPGVPSAIPHLAGEDQVVNVKGEDGVMREWFIPKGSLLLPNLISMDMDEKTWDKPTEIIVERWVNSEGKLIEYDNKPFGWGGRLCPGQPFAERSLFIMIASMLWAFKVEKVDTVDPKTGKPFVYDDTAMTGEFTCQPLPFPCRLVPKSEKHVEIIRKSWESQEKDLNNLMAFK